MTRNRQGSRELAGSDPLIAARYQIMIMAAVYSAGLLTAALFLCLVRALLDRRAAGA